jgi:hypothetical protein
MHFKLELILKQGFLDMEFEMPLDDADLPALVVRFCSVSDEKDKHYGNCLCTVITQITAPPKVAELLEKVPTPIPQNLQEFADDLNGQLGDAATRTLKLLRWFCGSSDGHNPIGASKGLTYSPDAIHWLKLPQTIKAILTPGIPELMMTDKVATSVADLWRQGAQQPLAQELFREATEQQSENPRSCLVLGVAATEIGFKQLVGNLVPDAKWLADNVPSPPLVTMLKDYVPILPTKFRLNGVKPKVPDKLIDTLKKAVLLRNHVVHGKAPKISRESLREIIEAIHDCLYLFDCYNGHRWAWNLITIETQRLILQESSGNSSTNSDDQ